MFHNSVQCIAITLIVLGTALRIPRIFSKEKISETELVCGIISIGVLCVFAIGLLVKLLR